jgi:hypothetical protein
MAPREGTPRVGFGHCGLRRLSFLFSILLGSNGIHDFVFHELFENGARPIRFGQKFVLQYFMLA